MGLFAFVGIVFCIVNAVTAAPFTGWLFGGKQNEEPAATRPTIFDKVQQLGERVYERKREFLNGVNEKVSNLLWIPPLYTTTEDALTPPPHVYHGDPYKYTENMSDEDEIPNVEIYARSSFLSPEDLVYATTPPEQEKPAMVTYNINKNFNILGRIWA
ncbi:uncharacterized protein LOC134217126 [Armigeres subalbatus]|uniref:uncharacterized protein LOC134217126 n=1 Tax=Armigeres subalbatus TaxID=124917 RepID=UPI002ED45774